MKYYCEDCDYETNLKANYDRHLASKKHNNKANNLIKRYVCTLCDYKCSDKSNFNKHCLSKRHTDNDPERQRMQLSGLIRTYEKRIITLNENPNMSYMRRWQRNDQTDEQCMNELRNKLEEFKNKLQNLQNHNSDNNTYTIEYVTRN